MLTEGGYFAGPTGEAWKCVFGAHEACEGAGAKLKFAVSHFQEEGEEEGTPEQKKCMDDHVHGVCIPIAQALSEEDQNRIHEQGKALDAFFKAHPKPTEEEMKGFFERSGMFEGATADFWKCIFDGAEKCFGAAGEKHLATHFQSVLSNVQSHLEETPEQRQCMKDKVKSECMPIFRALSQEDQQKIHQQDHAIGQWARAHPDATEEEWKAFLTEGGYFEGPTGEAWKCVFSAHEACEGAGAKLNFAISHFQEEGEEEEHGTPAQEKCMHDHVKTVCMPIAMALDDEDQEQISVQSAALQKFGKEHPKATKAMFEQFVQEHHLLDGPTADFWHCIFDGVHTCFGGEEEHMSAVIRHLNSTTKTRSRHIKTLKSKKI